MKKLKNLLFRIFMLMMCIGYMISYNSCVTDSKDKDLISIQSFLERHDGSKWTVIEDENRVYLKFNEEKDKALELWISELELEKLMTRKECFYHMDEMLNTEDVVILENSGSKLEFTYLGNETWTFNRDGERIKLEVKTLNEISDPIYFSKTDENFGSLNMCSEEMEKGVFDWEFLK